jgi:hypothetical protein
MELHSPLRASLADHRYLLAEVGRLAHIHDPVAVEPDAFLAPLLKRAVRGPFLPIEGVLVRDWDPLGRRANLGARLGARQYRIDGVPFARVAYNHSYEVDNSVVEFLVVARSDYGRLYRAAMRSRRGTEDSIRPPVLPDAQREALWNNTIGYLHEGNLGRIREFGGRPKRGLLLTGPPGNGKTSACRWLWGECRKRNWEWRLVTPDAYAAARRGCKAEQAVQKLFTIEPPGIVFFDDMDLALRDRETVKETDDQSVFLNALDGMETREGVAFVFTTNCALNLIDRAFQRPGRIDVVLHFGPPDADLRRRLFERWHPEIRGQLNVDRVIQSTDGFSFAEIEEVKNLLVQHFTESQIWDWDWAVHQFGDNRHDFAKQRGRVGFGSYQTSASDC